MDKLYVEAIGSGRTPLVLIHGWAMHGGVFAPLVEALRAHCTLYLVDLPGHGHSRDCTLPLDDLTALANSLVAATPPAIWLGWSLGGLVALNAALEHPGHVQALAMLCATPRFTAAADWPDGRDPALLRQLAEQLREDYHATLDHFLALETLGSKDPRGELRQLRELVFARGEPHAAALRQGLALLENADLRDRLDRLRIPNAWIAGRRDRLVHPQVMAWSAQRGGGSYAAIEHAGHAPFFGHADALAQHLLALIAAVAPGADDDGASGLRAGHEHAQGIR